MLESVIIFLLIILNGIFSMSEMALISARKSKLQQKADEGNKNAKAALDIASQPDRFLSSVQVGITLIGILTGVFSGNEIASDFKNFLTEHGMQDNYAAFLSKTVIVLTVMYFSIVFGELLPKKIGLGYAERVAIRVSRMMNIFSIAVNPVIILLSKTSSALASAFGIKEPDNKLTEEDIMSIIKEGTDDGALTEAENDIVNRVFTLSDLSISSIMTLKDDIVYLDVNMTSQEVMKVIESNIFEQYPVVEGDLDHVKGLLSIKDYVLWLSSGGEFNLSKMMSEPLFVHENMGVYDVLELMKQHKFNRTLVFDEFGSLQGIVSIRDILEALVGNVRKSEITEQDIIVREDGKSWLVDGQCSFFDFLGFFGLDEDIEDYDFSTVGGLILQELEHVPVSGEKVSWGNFNFEIVDMDGARIDKILVTEQEKTVEPEID